jgi:hypothetical protein
LLYAAARKTGALLNGPQDGSRKRLEVK